MNINNNEISIKYYYEGGKLYHLVYQIDDKVASLLPTESKKELEAEISKEAGKILSNNPRLVQGIKSLNTPDHNVSKLDDMLTKAVAAASKQVAKSVFTPPKAAAPVSSAAGTITIAPIMPTCKEFMLSIETKYLTTAEKNTINAHPETEQFAQLCLTLQTKATTSPDLFNQISQDFSNFLKNPQAVLDTTPDNLAKIIKLLAFAHSPPLTDPSQVLQELRPILKSNQELKNNLALIKAVPDVLDEKVKEHKAKMNRSCATNISAFTDRASLDEQMEKLFSWSDHNSNFYLKIYYFKALLNLVSSDEIEHLLKFNITSQAPNVQLTPFRANDWQDLPPNAKEIAMLDSVLVRKNEGGVLETDDAYNERLSQKIATLKDQIKVDILRMSYSIRKKKPDGTIETIEIKEKPGLDQAAAKEDAFKQLDEVITKIETYPLQEQFRIYRCLTQMFPRSSTEQGMLKFEGDIDADAIFVTNLGTTIYLEEGSNNITIFANSKYTIFDRFGPIDPIPVKDFCHANIRAHFQNSSEMHLRWKRYKQPLVGAPPIDPFDEDHLILSLQTN